MPKRRPAPPPSPPPPTRPPITPPTLFSPPSTLEPRRLIHEGPFLPESGYAGPRLPGQRGGGQHSPATALSVVRQALHHLRERRAAHAADHQEHRLPRGVRGRKAAGRFHPRAAQAAGLR